MFGYYDKLNSFTFDQVGLETMIKMKTLALPQVKCYTQRVQAVLTFLYFNSYFNKYQSQVNTSKVVAQKVSFNSND